MLDYVIGESEAQIGVPADHEVVAWLATNYPELRSRVEEARKRALDFLVKRYLSKALESGLDLLDLSFEKRIEPLDRKHSRVVIYYELYLLESLILLGYDVPGGAVSGSNRENVSKLFSKVIERFVEIRSLPESDSFGATQMPRPSVSKFSQKRRSKGKVFILSSFRIQASGLSSFEL
ncbi:MAG: hypothetical protein E6J34_23265 [Chloroflexi bacterium]|nr:MAG: hypothetical protein E6J34_23265 [Chloroflexota bacterium]